MAAQLRPERKQHILYKCKKQRYGFKIHTYINYISLPVGENRSELTLISGLKWRELMSPVRRKKIISDKGRIYISYRNIRWVNQSSLLKWSHLSWLQGGWCWLRLRLRPLRLPEPGCRIPSSFAYPGTPEGEAGNSMRGSSRTVWFPWSEQEAVPHLHGIKRQVAGDFKLLHEQLLLDVVNADKLGRTSSQDCLPIGRVTQRCKRPE